MPGWTPFKSGGLCPLALLVRGGPHNQHHSPGAVSLRLTPEIHLASERVWLIPGVKRRSRSSDGGLRPQLTTALWAALKWLGPFLVVGPPMQPATVRGTVERRLCFEPPGSCTIGTSGGCRPSLRSPAFWSCLNFNWTDDQRQGIIFSR